LTKVEKWEQYKFYRRWNERQQRWWNESNER
jgi:hypothetical protein